MRIPLNNRQVLNSSRSTISQSTISQINMSKNSTTGTSILNLPNEAILIILKILVPFRNDFSGYIDPNLVNCSQLSHRFRSLILPLIWRQPKINFDFEHSPRLSLQFSLNPTFMMNLVTELALAADCDDPYEDGTIPRHLAILLPMFNNLRRLRIYSDDEHPLSIQLSSALQGNNLKSLEVLEFMVDLSAEDEAFCIDSDHYPKLIRLHLQGIIKKSNVGKLGLIELTLGDEFPLIEINEILATTITTTLEILDLTFTEDIEHLRDGIEEVRAVFERLAITKTPVTLSLRSLTLRSFHYELPAQRSTTIQTIDTFTSIAPNLSSLHLVTSIKKFDWSIEDIESLTASFVTRLTLELCGVVTSLSSIINFLSSFPALLQFSIFNWTESGSRKVYCIGSLDLVVEDPVLNSLLYVIQKSNLLEFKLGWKDETEVVYQRTDPAKDLVGSLIVYQK